MEASAATTCDEVYDFAVGNQVLTCQRDRGHVGEHGWSGRDGVGNRLYVEWEPDNA